MLRGNQILTSLRYPSTVGHEPELGLGLLYLSRAWPMETYLFTAVLMTFGAIGVIIALRKGLDVKCACLGSFLEVPLSTVALTEDLGMAAIAIVMLVLM